MMGDDNPNKNIVINDYVICTIASWHAQYDREIIKKTSLECFGDTEMKTAMNAFCFNEDIVGAVVPASQHRQVDKCFDAIYRQLVALDAAGHMPHIVVQYKDLFKVPRRVPGEDIADPTLDRIAFLERSVARIVSQNENIMSELVDLKKNPSAPPSFSDIVAGENAATANPQQRSRINVQQPVQQVNVKPVTQERNHISAQDNQSRKPRSDQSGAVGNGNDNWQVQRRRTRPKAVQGTYKTPGANSGNLGRAAAPRNIFVYHTDIQTTVEDIKSVIEETSNVEILQIEKKSHEKAYYGSFRISVRRNDFEEATKPEHWPAGWSIREFFMPRAKRTDQEESADTAEDRG